MPSRLVLAGRISRKKNHASRIHHNRHAYVPPTTCASKKLPQPPPLGFDCAPLDLFVCTRGKHPEVRMHRSTVDTVSIEFFSLRGGGALEVSNLSFFEESRNLSWTSVGLSFFLTQKSGMFTWTYQPAYQLESTVFFSHNKSASAGLSTGFNTSWTGPRRDPI